MKKSTMKTIVSFIDTNAIDELREVRDEIAAELAKGEAKAQANRDMYAEAKDTILSVLTDTPATISEIYEEVKDSLPEGFTKSKVQYAITRLWASEVLKVEGKTNSYARKA